MSELTRVLAGGRGYHRIIASRAIRRGGDAGAGVSGSPGVGCVTCAGRSRKANDGTRRAKGEPLKYNEGKTNKEEEVKEVTVERQADHQTCMGGRLFVDDCSVSAYR
eukprot:766896-Hanusia_phi.AAC.9